LKGNPARIYTSISPGCARTPDSSPATTPRPPWPTTSAGSAPATSA